MRRRLLVLATAAVTWSGAIGAGRAWAAASEAPPPAEVVVRGVEDGATLILQDGRVVRLIGIDPPPSSTMVRGAIDRSATDHSLAGRAKAALAALAVGRTVRLYVSGPDADRYGRILAQARRDDGLWLEEAMLRSGLARVVPLSESREIADRLLLAEEAARSGRRGMWSLSAFGVRTPGDLRAGTGDFIIVEGRVAALSRVRGRYVLDVVHADRAMPGDESAESVDSGSDKVQVVIPADVAAEFKALDLDLGAAVGWTVRVRGWLERRNGVPQLEMWQRAQLEFVSPPGSPS